MTYDLDIVYNAEESNVKRLATALAQLEAFYRFPAERRLPPTESHLTAAGHVLLITKFGPLDVLGSVGKRRR